MASRKIIISKNSKKSDDQLLRRFVRFLEEPYSEKCGFQLQPTTLVNIFEMETSFVGMYLIAFIRILRPTHAPPNTDIIATNIEKKDPKNPPLYSLKSYKSNVSILLNALRRLCAIWAQEVIEECHKKKVTVPAAAKSPHDFYPYKNGRYGNVEYYFQTITTFLHIHKNKVNSKVDKYLSFRHFMAAFRGLEIMYNPRTCSPQQLLIFIIVRLVALIPGRSGAEWSQWMLQHITIREVWLRINIPKTWKNTKSSNKTRPFIKIANDDSLYHAIKRMISLRPKNAPNQLFLRPKKKTKV